MLPRKRRTLPRPAILLELVCHALMGTALGLSVGLLLTFVDNFGIARLIAHSSAPHQTFAILIGMVTLPFSVGATLTGFVFTMMEER